MVEFKCSEHKETIALIVAIMSELCSSYGHAENSQDRNLEEHYLSTKRYLRQLNYRYALEYDCARLAYMKKHARQTPKAVWDVIRGENGRSIY